MKDGDGEVEGVCDVGWVRLAPDVGEMRGL